MRCHACSTDNADTNGYCENCGARLGAACPQCGFRISASARFCGSCGASLATAEGERKHATVLFADIVGSTQLITGLDPEETMARLQPALAEMCAAVQTFEGTVVRTLGDGIMAFFGAPHAQEGHALLACEAALAMQSAFPPGGERPRIRVGLHSGDIVSRPIASAPVTELGAYGLTIHIASRLQELAEAGGICLSKSCYDLVRAYCDVEPLGPQKLKGFPEPIDVYRLVGLKPHVASQPFRGTQLSSFRGRDSELGRLQRTLSQTENGESKVVGISGAPGAGKSRLCYEFAEWCRGRLIPILETRAHPYGHATPLQPVLELLRLMLRVSPADNAAATRRRIAEWVSGLGSTFEADLPLLYEFLGVPEAGRPSSPLPPKARHARLIDVIRHLVRYGGANTSVIIFEDLHWIDEASEDFITALVDAVAGTRTMLVLNYRPSYSALWMTLSHVEQLPLPELSPAETTALVQELIGPAPELHEIRSRVAERSGGNPFFAEELVRSLAQNGLLLGAAGDYWLGTRIGEAALPATVEAVVGARIDGLGEAEKTVLQVSAIIGKEFPVAVLQDVVGPLASGVEAILGRLCEAELIQEQPFLDCRQFAFRHPLIQEVAYATQLKARRAAHHAMVADAMQRFYGNRLNEFAGLLAHHYEAAGKLEQAADYAARAAMWLGSTHPAQAIKHWRKVRLLLQVQPRSIPSDKLRILASGQIAWLGWREGMSAEEAKPFVREALGWAREIDDTLVPILLLVDGRITVTSGGPADAYVDRVKEGLSLLTGESAGRAATLNASLSQAYGWAGLLREALEASDAAMEGIAKVDPFDNRFLGYNVAHWAMGLRGRILVRLGRFEEAERSIKDMLRIEHTLHDPTVELIPHLACVDLAWCYGDARLGQEHAAHLADLAEKNGSPYLRVFALACRGTAEGVANNWSAAAHAFEASLEFARATKAALEYEPEILAGLAACYKEIGEPERALAVAKETMALSRMRSARLPECRACITYASVLLEDRSAGAAAKAQDLLRRAEDLIRVTGAAIFEPLLAGQRERMAAVAGGSLWLED